MSKLRNGGIITKSEYVGKTLQEATKYANDGGFSIRIVEKDGRPEMLDMSNKADRLNFRLRGELVIDVFGRYKTFI
jgi:hypothetical protein